MSGTAVTAKMTRAGTSARAAYRGGLTLLVAAALYEAIARSGVL